MQDAAHGEFALSGVLLARDGTRPGSAATEEPGTGHACVPGDPTRRVFAPGDRLVYTYDIYNAHDAVKTTPSVWHDGTPVFAAPAASIEPGPKPAGPLKVGGGLLLSSSMAPGDYVFQLAATSKEPKGHAKTVVRHVDFQVR